MWYSILGTAVFFFLMLAAVETGYRLGAARRRRLGTSAREGVGAVEGSVFALLGLIIAFTFSGASSRFDARRALIAEEANAISTAWGRTELLPAASREELRPLFQAYLDERLEATRGPIDGPHGASSEKILGQIRVKVLDAVRTTRPSPPLQLLVPALDAMSDIATVRRMARIVHPPDVVYQSLALTALLAAMLGGLAQGASTERSPLHTLVFCAVIAATAYMILDIEYPRAGLIRLDASDQVMVDVGRQIQGR